MYFVPSSSKSGTYNTDEYTTTLRTIDRSSYTLSGRIGKVHGCLACWSCKVDSWLSWACTDLYFIRSGGPAHEGGGCDNSTGSTVSDAIVCSLLWSTATGSSPLGYFSSFLQVFGMWFCLPVVEESSSHPNLINLGSTRSPFLFLFLHFMTSFTTYAEINCYSRI